MQTQKLNGNGTFVDRTSQYSRSTTASVVGARLLEHESIVLSLLAAHSTNERGKRLEKALGSHVEETVAWVDFFVTVVVVLDVNELPDVATYGRALERRGELWGVGLTWKNGFKAANINENKLNKRCHFIF